MGLRCYPAAHPRDLRSYISQTQTLSADIQTIVDIPQGSTLLQLLRGLNKAELQAIAERCEWCRVRKTTIPVSTLSKRIRESIDTNVEKGNVTYAEAMADIRDTVLVPGADSVAGKIRTHLRTVPTATHIGEVRIEE